MRKTYIDNIRWITVVLVVVYHIIFMFNGIVSFSVIGPFKDVQYQDAYQYIVYPWFMLLLFVVSGMSARFSIVKTEAKKFIKQRTIKYLVPSTLGLFVFWWILGYYNMLLGGVLADMGPLPKPILYFIMALSGVGPLWYIQMLWVFSVLLVLVRKIEKDRLYNKLEKTPIFVVILLVVLIYGAALILNTPVITVYRFGIYGAGFFIGYFVFSHDEVMDRLEKWWHVLSAIAIVCGVAFVIMYWGQNFADATVLETIMCNVYAWFATIAILAVMKKWGNFENSFTRFMKNKSWGIYLFHYLTLIVPAYYLHVYAPKLPGIVHYIVTAICAFGGSILLYEIFSRIPIIRYLVCGIKKKKETQKYKKDTKG